MEERGLFLTPCLCNGGGKDTAMGEGRERKGDRDS